MVDRFEFLLEPTEFSGLLKLAEYELRDPEAQLRYILRKELERLELLTPWNRTNETNSRVRTLQERKEDKNGTPRI